MTSENNCIHDYTIAGEDYANTSPQNHQVTFSAGETTQMLHIIINDDNVSEGNERFFVEIITTAEAGAAGVITGCDHTPQLTYEIIDNDGKYGCTLFE